MGYTVVWPRLKVKLVYASSLGVLTVMVDKQLPEDIVRVGGLLQVHYMYVTIQLVLFNLRPVSSALVLNTTHTNKNTLEPTHPCTAKTVMILKTTSATYSSPLHFIGCHDNDQGIFLPDHLPQVEYSPW